MKFEKPILEGLFLKRYKRFFADFTLNGKTEVAHVANTGSLKSVLAENIPCLVSFHNDPKRKLQYSLEMLKPGSSWVGINTSRPNYLVMELWESKKHEAWKKFDKAQLEVKISAESRIDLVMWNSKTGFQDDQIKKMDFTKCKEKFHFVEIKNVTLAQDSVALFPDAVTERGQKHLQELMHLVDLGHTAEMVFVIQREDCTSFAAATDIDPEYSKLLLQAQKHGVLITPLPCKLSPQEIILQNKELPFTHLPSAKGRK